MPHEILTQDVEYLRDGNRAMALRLCRPASGGVYPAVIDLHGGAWTAGDFTECSARDEAIARAGFVVAAPNFRQAVDGYPSSLQDINYAIRWLKAHAGEYRARVDRVGIMGSSSGGHLAMLSAMRPGDSRYAAIAPLPGMEADATVHGVAMLWPVINPLSRYRNAIRQRDSANPPPWTNNMKERHDTYWKTEAAMAEGNPMLALERGEPVLTPPALWVQGRPDPVHDYRDPDGTFAGNEPERFVANYRKAGGSIELAEIDQEQRATACVEPVIDFLRHCLS
ncbi:MAG TPA: alpha/beta hydrolase [Acetobacteraceae bacterium]